MDCSGSCQAVPFRFMLLGMKLKRIFGSVRFWSFLAAAVSLAGFAGCGPSESDDSGGYGDGGGAGEASQSAAAGGGGNGVGDAVVTKDGVTIVRITGNDKMQYNIDSFEVAAGSTVRIEFENIGKMPKSSMGHNVVVLKQGADAKKFATAASSHKDNDYIPPKRTDQILAKTAMLGPGETDTVEFTAPEPGEYTFLCSFPAHMFSGMKGTMVVK